MTEPRRPTARSRTARSRRATATGKRRASRSISNRSSSPGGRREQLSRAPRRRRPGRRAARSTAATIGMSMPRLAASRASTGAVKAPSATVRRSSSSSAAERPSPIALAEREIARAGRRAGEDEVAEARQAGQRLAPARRIASPKRVISAKPRAISAARAFWPRPLPSTTPQAIASTFLTAPPISAPATSSLQIDAEVRQGDPRRAALRRAPGPRRPA